MKHKLIKTENYILAVDNSEIKESCFVYKKTGEAHYEQGLFKIPGDINFDQFNKEKIHTYKVLAHLPLNNSPILEEVPLLPPLEQEYERNLSK